MRPVFKRAILALTATLLIAGTAAAQFPIPQNPNVGNEDSRRQRFKIKRQTVQGTVKSVEPRKKTLVLEATRGKEEVEMPIDVGPALIKAGRGAATFTDIEVGDRIRVFGEVTVHGGIRAMELTLPAERMSIPPPEKPRREKRERKPKPTRKKQAEPEPEPEPDDD